MTRSHTFSNAAKVDSLLRLVVHLRNRPEGLHRDRQPVDHVGQGLDMLLDPGEMRKRSMTCVTRARVMPSWRAMVA